MLIKFNRKVYEVGDEKFNRNTREEVNKDVSLKEIKEIVSSTQGYKKAPSARLLRCCCELVAAGTLSDCRMEVYSCGFAVYQTFDKSAVLRMEHVGRVQYDSDPSLERPAQDIDLADMPWTVGVLMKGEERLERWRQMRAEDTLVAFTGDGGAEQDDENEDMELAAEVNVESEVLDRLEMEEVVKLLSPRQCECSEMYYEMGMTQREIADVLGVSQQNIDLALKGAKKKMKNFLKNFD